MNNMDIGDLKACVDKYIYNTPVCDVHTHLFPASPGGFLLYGIDEMLTYHYLIVEYFRYSDKSYKWFFSLTKKKQAEGIWDSLFVKNTPISEVAQGIITTLKMLGIDPNEKDLSKIRSYFDDIKIEEYIPKIFSIAKVDRVVMTNDPFCKEEYIKWKDICIKDERFVPSLRLDILVNDLGKAAAVLNGMGYDVDTDLDQNSIEEICRFLNERIEELKPVYMAVSLAPDFDVNPEDSRLVLLEKCILPVAKEYNMPVALMLGVRRGVNPDLIIGGSGAGKANLDVVEYLCKKHKENKFMVTDISDDNQFELCVAARKFRNLMIFGCWWFCNNPVLVDHVTRLRLETLGTSFILQHSDARVLEQIIYKWQHTRKILSRILVEKYTNLIEDGYKLDEDLVKNDVEKLYFKSFEDFLSLKL